MPSDDLVDAAILSDNIRRFHLDVKTIAPFYGQRIVGMPELTHQVSLARRQQ